jgi:hypothetical protein
MSRFDSPEHVEAWQATGIYPRGHDDIAHMAMVHLRERRIMDLCCSTGLLGHRLLTSLKLDLVLSVDSSNAALSTGAAAGLIRDGHQLRVDRDSMPSLIGLIARERITAIIARRCIPELFGDDLALGHDFADLAAQVGVKQIFLEGRMVSANAMNRLASIDDEVELFDAHYKDAFRYRNVAVLVKR